MGILRKMHTGEPGNGGEFAATSLPDSGLHLAAPGALAHLSPSAVDELGSAAYQDLTRAAEKADRQMVMLRLLTRTSRRADLSDTEVLEIAQRRQGVASGDKQAVARHLTEHAGAVSQRQKAAERFQEAEHEWQRRGQWTRAFLVAGVGGHVHSSMSCSTCNRAGTATKFEWLTDYSGATQEQIVADAGYRACTVCYPQAPLGDAGTLPTRMFSSEEVNAQNSRETAKAKAGERRAKAIAAGLTPDGSPLRVAYSRHGRHWSRKVGAYVVGPFEEAEEFKTERTATTWYTDTVPLPLHGQPVGPDRGEREPVFTAIEEAIAAKRGVPVAEVVAELMDKARKKRR